MAYKRSQPPGHREMHLDRTVCVDPKITGGSLILQTPVIPVMQGIQAGNWVEWLSPALPKQQGEVMAVYQDGTFEVFHPLSERLCRLPAKWVIRIVSTSIGGR